ncbi:unnamed protein product, partial [Amoebophrya sp. A25]
QSSIVPPHNSLSRLSPFDLEPMKHMALLAGCNSGEAMPDRDVSTRKAFEAEVQKGVKSTHWGQVEPLSPEQLEEVRKEYVPDDEDAEDDDG